MSIYTNHSNVPLAMAVWLANDTYDHDPRNNHISATSLLKPTRQIVLATRVTKENQKVDIASLLKSRKGTAVHDGIESAWVNNHKAAMTALGYPARVTERVLVNPDPKELTGDEIPVYLEQRSEKEVHGFVVSGKFDFVAEGRVQDFKTTSTYTYQYGNKDHDYMMQGSLYRWLNPEIITEDFMEIHFMFGDWSAIRAKAEASKNYPPSDMVSKKYQLMSYAETDTWVSNKVLEIQKYLHAPDEEIPECTDKDLWRKPDVFKYYKNPEKRSRATKNFDNLAEAQLRLVEDGNVGVIETVKGTVGACKYCDAVTVCKQKDKYLATGELTF